MELVLPFPPTPAFMATHAARIVEIAQRIDHVDLDYTVESLLVVDRILGGFHDAGDRSANMAETVFLFGAYIGEVIVRVKGATWITLAPDHPLAGGGITYPMVRLPSGNLANPIGKAFKRVDNGPGDGIRYFYQVIVDG